MIEGVNSVVFRDCGKGIDHRRPPGGIMRSGKEEVLSAECYGPDGIFDENIAQLDSAVGQVRIEKFPLIECILHRDADG